MTKLRLFAAAALVAMLAGTTVMLVKPASAEVTMTPALTERIKSHCVENQATLNRLRQSDAFLRNDRGDLYRTISDKLMVPLNQRLASNQLDGSRLISVTANYNEEYKKFYTAYVDYDNASVKLLAIDCTKEPVTFYNALLDARAKRISLSKSNENLIKIIREYDNEFKTFQNDFMKKDKS